MAAGHHGDAALLLLLLLFLCAGECEGVLCMKQSWPAAIRTLFEDQARFETTYFAPYQVSDWLLVV